MWFYMHALKHFFIVFFILRITRPWKGFTLAGKLLRINRIFMLISTHESERVLWKMCQLFKRHRMSVSERGEWEEKKPNSNSTAAHTKNVQFFLGIVYSKHFCTRKIHSLFLPPSYFHRYFSFVFSLFPLLPTFYSTNLNSLWLLLYTSKNVSASLLCPFASLC